MARRCACSSCVLALVLVAAAAAGCAPQPTQIVLVVDSDLDVPGALARVTIEVESARTAPTRFDLPLDAPSTPDLPLTLALYPREASEVDVGVTVRGYDARGVEIVTRRVRTRFVTGSSRMLRVLLAARCVGVTCELGETCDVSGCRSIDVPGDSLPGWPGSPPSLDGPACEASGPEVCNGADDDCDGNADEGIDVTRDPEACGRCGHSCGSGACEASYCTGERPVRASLGGAHACVLREGGGVACWGWNLDGQAGEFVPEVRYYPADFLAIDGASALSAGGAFTCAVVAGAVECFGDGSHGELGDGMGIDAFAPVTVMLPAGVLAREVSAGAAHACAIAEDGTAWCWGRNDAGQLGDGTSETRLAPVAVTGIAGATAIAAGFRSTCAVVGAGGVRCWGANGSGQLGDGTTMSSPVPVAVLGVSDAVAVGVGRRHACALRASGGVACWGANESGQLGDGTTTGSPVAVGVAGVADASALAVALGGTHACVVRAGGAVTCWGSNLTGQLGDGTTDTRAMPVDAMIDGVVAIGAGGHADDGGGFSCAIDAAGAVSCWGESDLGRLGDGGYVDRGTPAPVIGLP